MGLTGISFSEPLAGLLALALLLAAILLLRRPTRRYYERNRFSHPLARFVDTRGYRAPRRLVLLEILLAALLALAIASPTISYTVTKVVEKQAATQLRVPPRPALVVIIDTSGSMSGWKIEAAKQAIRSLVEQVAGLNKTIDIGLISFSDRVKLAIPPTSNVSEILRAISELKAGGGTMYTYPLMTAYSWLSIYRHFNETAVIVFATDGLPADRQEYRRVLSKLASMGVRVYTVFIGKTAAGREETEYMARVGHGRSYTAGTAKELVNVFNEIAKEASKVLANVTVQAKLSIRVTEKQYLAPYLYSASVILLAILALMWSKELGLAV